MQRPFVRNQRHFVFEILSILNHTEPENPHKNKHREQNASSIRDRDTFEAQISEKHYSTTTKNNHE